MFGLTIKSNCLSLLSIQSAAKNNPSSSSSKNFTGKTYDHHSITLFSLKELLHKIQHEKESFISCSYFHEIPSVISSSSEMDKNDQKLKLYKKNISLINLIPDIAISDMYKIGLIQNIIQNPDVHL